MFDFVAVWAHIDINIGDLYKIIVEFHTRYHYDHENPGIGKAFGPSA
jgi:hypothetical protein